jgi:hypothetical protein
MPAEFDLAFAPSARVLILAAALIGTLANDAAVPIVDGEATVAAERIPRIVDGLLQFAVAAGVAAAMTQLNSRSE